jgi:hypothetical protein
VHLTEKVFHLVTALVDHLLEHHLGPDPALAHHLGHDGAGGRPTGQPHAAGDLPPAARRAIALTVYRDAPVVLGAGRWREFLEAFNDLARAQARDGRTATAGRPIPDLDPLFPALSAAVDHWAGAGRALSIVHDEQVSLTPERVRAAIGASSPDPLGSDPLSPDPLSPDPLSPDSHPNGALSLGGATLRLVDSQTDPRVQVADFLAGAARRIASEELNGRGDARLTALLRPYLDPGSIWGDPVSWARLAP